MPQVVRRPNTFLNKPSFGAIRTKAKREVAQNAVQMPPNARMKIRTFRSCELFIVVAL
jgi:hypothetical protein